MNVDHYFKHSAVTPTYPANCLARLNDYVPLYGGYPLRIHLSCQYPIRVTVCRADGSLYVTLFGSRHASFWLLSARDSIIAEYTAPIGAENTYYTLTAETWIDAR